MPRLFALDSSIVVILGGGASSEPRARERAEGILLEHEDSGEHVGIPAAGWAECCSCELETSTSFMIWPLNAVAAELANRLTPPMIGEGQASGATRQQVKIDALILATAEIVGCTAIYATDPWFDNAAKREGLRVAVRPLPQVRPRQVSLPELPHVVHDAAKRTGNKR